LHTLTKSLWRYWFGGGFFTLSTKLSTENVDNFFADKKRGNE